MCEKIMTLLVKEQILDRVTPTDNWLISILAYTVFSYTEREKKKHIRRNWKTVWATGKIIVSSYFNIFIDKIELNFLSIPDAI